MVCAKKIVLVELNQHSCEENSNAIFIMRTENPNSSGGEQIIKSHKVTKRQHLPARSSEQRARHWFCIEVFPSYMRGYSWVKKNASADVTFVALETYMNLKGNRPYFFHFCHGLSLLKKSHLLAIDTYRPRCNKKKRKKTNKKNEKMRLEQSCSGMSSSGRLTNGLVTPLKFFVNQS